VLVNEARAHSRQPSSRGTFQNRRGWKAAASVFPATASSSVLRFVSSRTRLKLRLRVPKTRRIFDLLQSLLAPPGPPVAIAALPCPPSHRQVDYESAFVGPLGSGTINLRAKSRPDKVGPKTADPGVVAAPGPILTPAGGPITWSTFSLDTPMLVDCVAPVFRVHGRGEAACR